MENGQLKFFQVLVDTFVITVSTFKKLYERWMFCSKWAS